MHTIVTARTQPEVLTTKELASFFASTPAFAMNLMQRLDIPRRGTGYPIRRISLALGFSPDASLEQSLFRTPLADVRQIAQTIGVPEKMSAV